MTHEIDDVALDMLSQARAERIMELEALLGEAVAGLEPFAKQAPSYDPDEGDDRHPLWNAGALTIGDLRAARALLAKIRATLDPKDTPHA